MGFSDEGRLSSSYWNKAYVSLRRLVAKTVLEGTVPVANQIRRTLSTVRQFE